jgi:hypothetical protein
MRIEQTFAMTDGPLAHQLSEQGHAAGKIVLTVP